MAEEIVFPNKLKQIRVARGMRMQDLADELNVSLSAISKIEHGLRRINQEQAIKIMNFLDCSFKDIFLSDSEEDKKHIEQWKQESENRIAENENNGLKVFGAGLRFLREQQSDNIEQLAKKAGLTTSVYHRTEMGQRDVFAHEAGDIAKALGQKPEDLIVVVQTLLAEGKLDKYLKFNEGKFRLFTSSDMFSKGNGTVKKYKIPLYSTVGNNGEIVIQEKESDFVDSPGHLEEDSWQNVYSFTMVSDRLGSIIPKNSIIVVDETNNCEPGSLAVKKEKTKDGQELNIYTIEKESDGKVYASRQNPAEKIKLTKADCKKYKKVVFIEFK